MEEVVATLNNDDNNVNNLKLHNNSQNNIIKCNNTTPNKANASSPRKIYNTRSSNNSINNCNSIETTQKLLKEIIINDSTNGKYRIFSSI